MIIPVALESGWVAPPCDYDEINFKTFLDVDFDIVLFRVYVLDNGFGLYSVIFEGFLYVGDLGDFLLLECILEDVLWGGWLQALVVGWGGKAVVLGLLHLGFT